jgi:hypothetical protein
MRRKTMALSGMVVLGLLAIVSLASAAEIQVCEHSNFGGRCVTLRHGVNDLRDWGMSNTISSIRVRSGTWRLCDGQNLQGRCHDFSRSVSDLRGTPLQDAVSSLRPLRVGGPDGERSAIVVYSQRDFRGRSWVFSDDIPDLRRLGLNDQISSIRVLGGRWQVCADIDFRGCRSIREDVPDLDRMGWNNRISSIREGERWWGSEGGGGFDRPGRGGYDRPGQDEYDRPGRGDYSRPGGGYDRPGRDDDRDAPVMLFSDTGFRGRSFPVGREIRNLDDVGFNDMAASIRISRGRWQVCTDSDFRGRCEVISGDRRTLGSVLHRQISSIRPY